VLLLQDQVTDTGFLVDLVDQPVELVEELLLLPLKVLELLESDLVLPLDLLARAFKLGDALLGLSELLHDHIVFALCLEQLANLLIGLSQWLHNFIVGLLLVHLFLLSVRVLFPGFVKLIF